MMLGGRQVAQGLRCRQTCSDTGCALNTCCVGGRFVRGAGCRGAQGWQRLVAGVLDGGVFGVGLVLRDWRARRVCLASKDCSWVGYVHAMKGLQLLSCSVKSNASLLFVVLPSQ
jgi:hypothetical protein